MLGYLCYKKVAQNDNEKKENISKLVAQDPWKTREDYQKLIKNKPFAGTT